MSPTASYGPPHPPHPSTEARRSVVHSPTASALPGMPVRRRRRHVLFDWVVQLKTEGEILDSWGRGLTRKGWLWLRSICRKPEEPTMCAGLYLCREATTGPFLHATTKP